MPSQLESLFFVALVSALAPVVSRLIPGPIKIPAVVFLLIGGILIGPEVLNLASPEGVSILATLGLSFLFLLAGYELDPKLMRQPPGKLAQKGWLLSALLSIGVTALLWQIGLVQDFLGIAVALTTTALGTLLPIMRDNGILADRIGPFIFAAGAVGEFLPIVAMALLLTGSGPIVGMFALFGLAVVTMVVLWLMRLFKERGWVQRLDLPEEHTGQAMVRWTLVILVALVWSADVLGLDLVLGAFLCGVVLRHAAPLGIEELEKKLDVAGYGFFIPIFFVASGMSLDVISVLQQPQRLLVFVVLLFAVRGLPALFIYRKVLDRTERWQMVFLTATALPLLVALSEVGLRSGVMLPANAAALVGAGAVTVLVFPIVAGVLQTRKAASG